MQAVARVHQHMPQSPPLTLASVDEVHGLLEEHPISRLYACRPQEMQLCQLDPRLVTTESDGTREVFVDKEAERCYREVCDAMHKADVKTGCWPLIDGLSVSYVYSLTGFAEQHKAPEEERDAPLFDTSDAEEDHKALLFDPDE